MTERQNRTPAGIRGAVEDRSSTAKQSINSPTACRGHAGHRPPYLHLNRQRLWRGHYWWSLNLRTEKQNLRLANSEHESEIFTTTLKWSRHLRVPVLGRWLGAYQRFHRRRPRKRAVTTRPASARELRRRQYLHRQRMVAKRQQIKQQEATAPRLPRNSTGGVTRGEDK